MAISIATDAATGWRMLRDLASNIKWEAVKSAAYLAANSVKLEDVISLYRDTQNIRSQLLSVRDVAGLTDFARSALADPTFDAVAEINALVALIDDAAGWINTNASGLALTGAAAADAVSTGSVVTNRFTPAQTAGLQVKLNAISAFIAS